MASAQALADLGSTLVRDPSRFRDEVAALAEVRVDQWFGRWLTRRPVYQTVAWDQAIDELADRYPNVREVLTEAALAGIEAHVRRRIAEISAEAPVSFKFNADLFLAQACYVGVRLLRPAAVVETGVAYGMSSAFILQALEENGEGRLYSIDLPPVGPRMERLVGAVIPAHLKQRWELHLGPSNRILPRLLRDIGQIDLFIHDSMHTYRSMRREYETALPYLRPGGFLLSDDVHRNKAFGELSQRGLAFVRVIEQRDKAALFGFAIK